MSAGAALIKAERLRQAAAEGYDAAHDLGHRCGLLASAAIAYCCHARQDTPSQSYLGTYWPPGWTFKGGKPLDDLVKAGALALAEADRITTEIDRLIDQERRTGTAAESGDE